MFVQIRIRIRIKSFFLSGFILCHFIDNTMLNRSSYLLLGWSLRLLWSLDTAQQRLLPAVHTSHGAGEPQKPGVQCSLVSARFSCNCFSRLCVAKNFRLQQWFQTSGESKAGALTWWSCPVALMLGQGLSSWKVYTVGWWGSLSHINRMRPLRQGRHYHASLDLNLICPAAWLPARVICMH